MSVGLPGSGVGGVFYILSALLMPVDGAVKSVSKRVRPRFRLLTRQVLLALAILAAIYATGWALDHLTMFVRSHAHGAIMGNGGGNDATPHVFREAAVLLTFGTLGTIMFGVQILRLFFAGRQVQADEVKVEERKAA